MIKGILFMLLVLSTGVKADQLSEDYYQGRTDVLWDAAVGLCIQSGTKDLTKCAQSTYEALEAASNEVVIND